jgi:hypothetical protein
MDPRYHILKNPLAWCILPRLCNVLPLRATLRLLEDKPSTHQRFVDVNEKLKVKWTKTQNNNVLTHKSGLACISK